MHTPKLVVHIGAAKCGSSSIQEFLRLNREKLLAAKILVPGQDLDVSSETTGHQLYFFQQLVESEDAHKIFRGKIDALYDYCVDNGLEKVIVSAENLINSEQFSQLFEFAKNKFEISVICYVRRQDDYFLSAWQQWKLKTFSSIHDYISTRVGIEANWYEALKPWEELVELNQISVRPFVREHLLNSDVVADFSKIAKFETLDLKPVTSVRNRSFNEHLGDVAHRLQDLFEGPHDNRFFEVMGQLIGEPSFKDRKATHLLTLGERLDLLARYESANEKLRKKYLDSEVPPPLFKNPTESDVIHMTESEKRKKEIDLLFRAVYELARKPRS